uniref:Methyltransferase n=1 Tax=viral metagenome TaxID=1070528 RepID=A0A6C0E4S3_9ZZZZ
MSSSYTNNLNYGDIFATLCYTTNPRSIVEIGILNGFSLKSMVENVSSDCLITAYDIFEEFNGNSAKKLEITEMFSSYKNITINYGDFYKVHESLTPNSVDIIHIDIANDGDVYNFALIHYMDKLKENGILVLEGGSFERDQVYWMLKYNKRSIQGFVNQVSDKYKIKTIGTMPSLTFITRK